MDLEGAPVGPGGCLCVPNPVPPPTVPPHHPVVCCSAAGPQICTKRPGRSRTLLGSQRKRRKSATPDPKEKQTCGKELCGALGHSMGGALGGSEL